MLASLPVEESEKAIAGEPEGEHHSGFLTLNVQLPEMQAYAWLLIKLGNPCYFVIVAWDNWDILKEI